MTHTFDEDIIGSPTTRGTVSKYKLFITIGLTLFVIIALCTISQYDPLGGISQPDKGVVPQIPTDGTPPANTPVVDAPISSHTQPKPPAQGETSDGRHIESRGGGNNKKQPVTDSPSDEKAAPTPDSASSGAPQDSRIRPEASQPPPSSPPPIPPLFANHEIIVTLTTIPGRMQYLNTTLLSLAAQSVPPTEIVLNIPYTSRRFPNPHDSNRRLEYDLPQDFLQFIHRINTRDPSLALDLHKFSRQPRITIHRCDDDGPATKLLPTLAREFSLQRFDSILLIADDDVYYPTNWVETIVSYYLTHPQLHYTALGYRGYCVPPNNTWEWRIISQIATSARQVYNITQSMNSMGVITHEGSPKPIQPTRNASRFIYRDFNVTLSDNEGNMQLNPDFSLLPMLHHKGIFSSLKFIKPFPEPLVPNSLSKQQQLQVLELIYDYLDHYIDQRYSPIPQQFPHIYPYTPMDMTYAAHTHVDIITGNNGFLLRPYYFLRHSPFIGNITAVDVVLFNHEKAGQLTYDMQRFQYTTDNSLFRQLKSRQLKTQPESSHGKDESSDQQQGTPQTETLHDRFLRQSQADHTRDSILTTGLGNVVSFGNFTELLSRDQDETRPTSTQPPDGLPPSVYYMDDIWFNGILARNSVSRAVISSANDPYHRQKVQDNSATLENVPIGRAYHNNVLLKHFGQYWSNCPYILPNLSISEFYLRYAEPSKSQFNSVGPSGAPQSASNPWLHWGVADDETNIAQFTSRFSSQPNNNTPRGSSPQGPPKASPAPSTGATSPRSQDPSGKNLTPEPNHIRPSGAASGSGSSGSASDKSGVVSPPPQSPAIRVTPSPTNVHVPMPDENGNYLAELEDAVDPSLAEDTLKENGVIDSKNIAHMFKAHRQNQQQQP